MTAIVQTKEGAWVDSGAAVTVTFTSTPTNGNTMVAFLYEAEHSAAIIDTTGWTLLTRAVDHGNNSVAIWTKVAGASEPTSVHIPVDGVTSTSRALHLYEVSGAVDVYGTSVDGVASGQVTGPTLTASTAGVLLDGIVGYNPTYAGTAVYSPLSPLAETWPVVKDSPGRVHRWSGSHTVTPGSYTPAVNVSVYGLDSAATAAVIIGSSLPGADFTDDAPVEAGETVHFTDTSTNSPTSWAWDFGDGGTSTSQNPTHVYTGPGTFSVTLTATNAFGSDSVTHTVHVLSVGIPDPPEPSGVLLEIYAHAAGAARWDVAKWDEDVWGEGGWRDVTPYGMTVDIDWGSRRPELGILSTPDTASWNVEYYDPDRVLDPANEDGPYFGDLIPFLPIRVSHRGTVVRRGYASVISHNYSDPGRGGMRGADNISVLANAMVPSDTTLSNTLYARAVDAIAAAGLTVSVAAPVGTDPPVSPWVTATREWSVWDWIKDAAQEVLYIPIMDRLGTLTFRPWASPLARGRVIGSPELIDLGVVTDWSGLFSVITARLDEDTIETRALTPPPRYGARTYARDEDTLNAGDWAATVLADRGLPTLLWKPGDMRPLTAVSTELLATIEAVELVTLSYPEADPPITASGIVVGGSIHIEGKRDDSAIWRFHFELAQTATEPLIETGGEDTDYLLRTGGGEYLYPTGSA